MVLPALLGEKGEEQTGREWRVEKTEIKGNKKMAIAGVERTHSNDFGFSNMAES
jgi:hypothetical protein